MRGQVSYIPNAAFKGCTSLTTVDIPESVTKIEEEAFNGCTALASATIGDGVITIGKTAFENCKGLTKVIIGSNVKSIGYRAFSNCVSLKEVVLPEYVTTLESVYPEVSETFRNCTALAKVTLGKRINSMGSSVFTGCTNLQQVVIMDGCSVINSKCFNGCNNIQTITNYCVELPTTAADAFSSYTAALYVPEASYSLYKATEPWSKFGTIATIEGGVPNPETKKVATPTIEYVDGKLLFNCETEGATCQYSVSCVDNTSGSGNELELTAALGQAVMCKGRRPHHVGSRLIIFRVL
jgi:hypothetical protein